MRARTFKSVPETLKRRIKDLSSSTRCNDECTLEFRSQDDEVVQKKLSEFRHGPIGFALGNGHVHVDSTTVVDDPIRVGAFNGRRS